MDAHPIPQNVTSFQFKLIGDMTLKQFLYLASGLGLAYILFVSVGQKYPLFVWPLIVFFALGGVAFAFLPIQSRPLDRWLVSFFKAVYSPTKRTWKKNNKNFKEDPLFGSRLVMYLSGQPVQASNQSNTPSPLSAEIQSPAPSSMPAPRPPEPLPSKEELGKTVDLARQAQQLQMKIIQSERTLSQIKAASQKPSPIPVDYSQEVNKILADLSALVSQASFIKQQMQKVQEEQKAEIVPVESIKERVKVVVPVKPKPAQIALTTFPNIINGIIKDASGNYLEGTVAVIYDKEGLPVRALKTNKLGQFTGSTPLPNGIYTLELEKDTFSFDVLQIELTGGVLPPLMITAKPQT